VSFCVSLFGVFVVILVGAVTMPSRGRSRSRSTSRSSSRRSRSKRVRTVSPPVFRGPAPTRGRRDLYAWANTRRGVGYSRIKRPSLNSGSYNRRNYSALSRDVKDAAGDITMVSRSCVIGRYRKPDRITARLHPACGVKSFWTGRHGTTAGTQMCWGLCFTKASDIDDSLANNSALIGDQTVGLNGMTTLYQPTVWDKGSQSHMILERISSRLVLASSITTPFSMDVYMLLPTRDIPKYDLASAGGTTGGMDNPVVWFTRCIQAHQQTSGVVGGDSPMTETTIGLRPDNPLWKRDFCKYWKIVKKMHVEMEPGRQITLNNTVHCNRRIQGYDTQTFSVLKGCSLTYLIFAQGTLVWSAASSNATVPDTFGSAYVDAIHTQTIYSRMVPFTRTKLINQSAPGLMALNDQGFINSETNQFVAGATIDN